MTSYVPHSQKTKLAYERLLREVKNWVPPGMDSVLTEFTSDIIAACRAEAAHSNAQAAAAAKRQLVHQLFDRSLPSESYHRILDLCGQLTDFVATSHGATQQAEDQDYFFDDEEEDDDDSADDDDNVANKTKKKKKSAAEKEDPQMSKYLDGNDITIGDDEDSNLDEDGMEGGGAADDATVLMAEVTTYDDWLYDALRRLFPNLTPAECTAKALKVLEYLMDQSTDAFALETQLSVFLGGYDDESVMDWISLACNSRWAITYGVAYAKALKQADKSRVLAEMSAHGRTDRAVAKAFEAFTGKEVVGAKGAASDDDPSNDGSGHQAELRLVDLQGIAFSDETSASQGRRVVVPQGTKKAVFDTHDEFILPQTGSYRGTDPLTPLTILPDWARLAFPKEVQRFNPMQSKVFDCAFTTDHNMLVCAPTGAGKTNVAMLAILRALSKCYDPASDALKLDHIKMVYIAPMKALVQEVVTTFAARLEPLGVRVAELTGDAGLNREQLAATQLIVATPEKWDVVTRKSMELGVASMVRLMIIDETHLLHNDRGPVLESVVARFLLRSRRQLAESPTVEDVDPVRLVGLSATLPNYMDVARLLQVDTTQGLFYFDASYRPVPLQQIYCSAKRVPQMNSVAVLNHITYKKMMEHVHLDQVMVFVHSRKDTEYTAQYLLNKLKQDGKQKLVMNPGSEAERAVEQILQEHDAGLRDSLKQLLAAGFGIHHAGMSREERTAVEDLFRDRHLRVLVCTSTLAWGVNLPANAVIIKGTQIFSGEKGKTSLLSLLDVLQMFGRAGRFGFGSVLGEATIITNRQEDLMYYLSALNQQLPIESQFVKRLVDAMNAEIVLGSIQTIAEAVTWLKQTYFYVRLMATPELYGARKSARDPLYEQHLANVAHTAAEMLRRAKLVQYDAKQRTIRSTELGRIASHFYVTCESMKVYSEHLREGMHDSDIFRAFSFSSEFESVTVREEEKIQLNLLLDNCPIAVREGRTTAAAKVNVLLQCYISGMHLKGLPLMSELVYIQSSAQRCLRAMYEICLVKEYATTARNVLYLYLMVLRQQWAVQSPLRQLKTEMATKDFQFIIHQLEGKRVSWEQVRSWSMEDMQEMMRDDERRAEIALRCVQRIPFYNLNVAVRPLSHTTLYLDLDLTPAFTYDASLHNAGRELMLTVEHPSGSILHTESIWISAAALEEQETVDYTIVVPVTEPRATHYHVRIMSTSWIGCEASVAVNLMDLALPAKGPALRELTDDASQFHLTEHAEDRRDVAKNLAPYHLDGIGAKVFPFSSFNPAQYDVLESLFTSEESMFVGLPPGGGKTAIAELFVLSFLLHCASSYASEEEGNKKKLLYLTASPAVAARRAEEWNLKFHETLGQRVALLELGAPLEVTASLIQAHNILVAPAAAVLPLVRRGGAEFAHVTHLIADHLHTIRAVEGSALESCLSRMLSPTPTRILNAEANKPARVLALSYYLMDCSDLCRWLRILRTHRFNFGATHGLLQTVIDASCDVPGYHNRLQSVMMRAVKSLDTDSLLRGGSKVLFVSTAAMAVESAQSLVLARGELPLNDYEGVDDANLATMLAAGVGYLHGGTSLLDRLAILQCAEQQALTLFATMESSWSLPAAAFTSAVVCLAERGAPSASEAEEYGQQLFVDCTTTELLQMVTRASRHAVVYCRRSRRWVLERLLNSPLPLESANRHAFDFCETINAAVAERGLRVSMQDLLRVLQNQYLYAHLRSNPRFYHVASTDAIASSLSDLCVAVVQSLAETGCVRVHDDGDTAAAAGGGEGPMSLSATTAGLALAQHNVSLDSLRLLRAGLEQAAAEVEAEAASTPTPSPPVVLPAFVTLLKWLCACSEVRAATAVGDSAQVRSGEVRFLRNLHRSLKESPFLSSPGDAAALDSDFSPAESPSKVLLMVLAHCTRLLPVMSREEDAEGLLDGLLVETPLSVRLQFAADAAIVVPVVVRLAQAAVELLPSAHWPAAKRLADLTVAIGGAMWVTDPRSLLRLRCMQGVAFQLQLPDGATDLTVDRWLQAVAALEAGTEDLDQLAARKATLAKEVWRRLYGSSLPLSNPTEWALQVTAEAKQCPSLVAMSAVGSLLEPYPGSFVFAVRVTLTVDYGVNGPQTEGREGGVGVWLAVGEGDRVCYTTRYAWLQQQQQQQVSLAFPLTEEVNETATLQVWAKVNGSCRGPSTLMAAVTF